MIGRFRERQYQLNVQKRNEACVKFDYYRQTARYFERECSKAKQFNAWNVQDAKENKHFQILRKAESLNLRRNKLRELLKSEEQIFTRQCQQLKSRRTPTADLSLAAFRDRLKEKRAEENLYLPRTCRRIQSYLYPRSVLKESNESISRKVSRMSLENTNLRDENPDVWERKSEGSDDARSTFADHRENELKEQADYSQRMDEYKENTRSARASNLYGPDARSEVHESSAERNRRNNQVHKENDEREAATFKYNQSRPGAGLSTSGAESRCHMRKLHDSHFLLGNETYLQEGAGGFKEPNQKFTDRYAHRSLEATNVGETAGHSIESGVMNEEGEAKEVEQLDEIQQTAEGDATGDGSDHEQDDNKSYDGEVGAEEIGAVSMKCNDSQDGEPLTSDETDRCEEQQDINREVGAKASARLSDHRHFESEKSLPWLRMIPGDQNLSEQMFLYLTHNELKGQILDLEKRENHAASKHQWDEALRLRDMRNRLDLARERNLYRREDLLLDPEVKKLGMAGIEARSKLLKEREELCTNSSMYSEEAKILWNQWIVEDQKSVFEDARLLREDLMKQLEENWRSLAVEDKQKISDSFNKELHVGLQHEHEMCSSMRTASR